MRHLQNRDGFALITALMFTMLSLVITLSLLYMVTAGIKTSGTLKSYRSTTDAAYGGVDIMIKDIINSNLLNASTMDANTFSTQMTNYVASFSSASVAANCLQIKLTTASRSWPAACADKSLSANASSYDIKFSLNGKPGEPAFNVYAKIVDTMEYIYDDYTPDGTKVTIRSAGNTDLSTTQLEGSGVVNGSTNNNPSQPYMYRIEVQAERPAPYTEKSKISVQYVY